MPPSRTSTCLLSTINGLDGVRDRPKPSNLMGIQDDLLNSCLGLVRRVDEKTVEILHGRREAAEWLLDDLLCRHFISDVPDVVKRTLRFDGVVVDKTVPEFVAAYLREATQAYVVGLSSACIALCRSALEGALKDRLPPLLVTDWRLAALLKASERSKTLPVEEQLMATEIQTTANRVLHGDACTVTEAFDTLVRTRRVLERLYVT